MTTTPLPQPCKTEKVVNGSGELEYENFYTEGVLLLYADIKARQARADLEAEIERKGALLKQALSALEESETLVRSEYQEDWRHGLPTRKAQLDAALKLVEAHEQAVIAIKQELSQ